MSDSLGGLVSVGTRLRGVGDRASLALGPILRRVPDGRLFFLAGAAIDGLRVDGAARSEDGTRFREVLEPDATSKFEDYATAAEALRLVRIPEDASVDEAFGWVLETTEYPCPRHALGDGATLGLGSSVARGVVVAVEACFWLNAEGEPRPYAGAIEVRISPSLDREALEPATPAFDTAGALIGFVAAVDGDTAMIAPARDLLAPDAFACATRKDIVAHNIAATSLAASARLSHGFDETIRSFGTRIASSPASYSRAVGA